MRGGPCGFSKSIRRPRKFAIDWHSIAAGSIDPKTPTRWLLWAHIRRTGLGLRQKVGTHLDSGRAPGLPLIPPGGPLAKPSAREGESIHRPLLLVGGERLFRRFASGPQMRARRPRTTHDAKIELGSRFQGPFLSDVCTDSTTPLLVKSPRNSGVGYLRTAAAAAGQVDDDGEPCALWGLTLLPPNSSHPPRQDAQPVRLAAARRRGGRRGGVPAELGAAGLLQSLPGAWCCWCCSTYHGCCWGLGLMMGIPSFPCGPCHLKPTQFN